MTLSTRWLMVSMSVAVWLWPAAVFAQVQETPGAEAPLTLDQVRGTFAIAGYQTDQALNWNWMSPSATTFHVHDPASHRIVLVLVYGSVTEANAARPQAEAHEQARNGGLSVGDRAPQFVVGYGPSAWVGNVAMVQTSQTRLEHQYEVQNSRDFDMSVDPNELFDTTLPGATVDLDFQQALRNATVSL